MDINNPHGYANGWNMWLTGWLQVFRYWYLSMFWQLGWTGVALINYIFCFAGLDSAFNIINLLSILGPLGNIALTSVSYFLYSTHGPDLLNPDFGDNTDDYKALFGNIIASTQQLTISILTLLAW